MAYARARMNAEVGNNLIAHQEAPSDIGGRLRNNNTFSSNI